VEQLTWYDLLMVMAVSSGRYIKTIAAQFGSVDFVHENRRSNVDAHTIARSAIYFGFGRQGWL
jgi:hypothetical protein